MPAEEMRNDCARVGRCCGGGTEKHSGSRAAVTGERTDQRIDRQTDGWNGWNGWMDGWLGWLGRWKISPTWRAVEGGGVRQTGFITLRVEVERGDDVERERERLNAGELKGKGVARRVAAYHH